MVAITKYDLALPTVFPYRGVVTQQEAEEIMALLVTPTVDGAIPEGSSFAVNTGNPLLQVDNISGKRVMWLSEISRARVFAEGRWPDIGWEPGDSEIIRYLQERQNRRAAEAPEEAAPPAPPADPES